MYLEHFQLSCRPFESSADYRFLYLSPQHAKALANIEFALTNNDNFVIISGEIGVGKTTLLNQIIADLPNDVVVAKITHTTLSPTELLQNILLEFGIPCFKKNKVFLLQALTEFFQEQQKAGKQVAILIDEAQNLSKRTLEELRLLSCQSLELSNLLTIVLLGQPELNEIIDSPELQQLSQRTRIRQHITPLNEKETHSYLTRRLAVAGGKLEEIMTGPAIEQVYAYTGGVPRMVNTLCELSFTAAWIDEADKVDVKHIVHAADELRWQPAATSTVTYSDTAEAREPLGWLLHTGIDSKATQVPIFDLPFYMGRSATTNLQLRYPHISRRHALIERCEGQLVIKDFNSYNGTFVNGQRITQTHELADGDRIGFGGGLQLTFQTQADYPAEVDATTETEDQAISA